MSPKDVRLVKREVKALRTLLSAIRMRTAARLPGQFDLSHVSLCLCDADYELGGAIAYLENFQANPAQIDDFFDEEEEEIDAPLALQVSPKVSPSKEGA